MKSSLRRLYSSPSSSRPAFVLESVSRPRPAPLPPQPSPSSSSPPSFIPTPKPRSQTILGIKSLSKASPSSTTIHFDSPSSPSLTVPNLFLRDSSIHQTHLHPSSQQKLFRTTDVPIEGDVVGYGVNKIEGQGDCLVTEWTTPVYGVDPVAAKLAVVPVELLKKLLERRKVGALPTTKTWDESTLVNGGLLHKVTYEDFTTSTKALHETLTSLVRTGIAFVSGVPTEKKEGVETELKSLVERIGSLRRTWYGDLWDVKAEEGSKNIAYTNLDLGLHMDLTHFETPPRYQFLHSLLNTSIVGGASYFVDSFHLASLLRESHPSAYTTLCTSPVLFSYKNGGKHTRWARPTIELSPSGSIWAINYSPPFQGNLLLGLGEHSSEDETRLEELHFALSLFAELAKKEEMTYRVQLEPGDCVVFDNRRVLHARTAFEFEEKKEGVEEGERGRWLKGAYMDGDEVWSKWRVLEEERVKGKLD